MYTFGDDKVLVNQKPLERENREIC